MRPTLLGVALTAAALAALPCPARAQRAYDARIGVSSAPPATPPPSAFAASSPPIGDAICRQVNRLGNAYMDAAYGAVLAVMLYGAIEREHATVARARRLAVVGGVVFGVFGYIHPIPDLFCDGFPLPRGAGQRSLGASR